MEIESATLVTDPENLVIENELSTESNAGDRDNEDSHSDYITNVNATGKKGNMR